MILIDTPAGLFIVAEECSGVKFLIAMLALGLLVAHTCFASWNRRAWFLIACVVVPIIANGIRAWATIFLAQYVGAEAAGGFDHIVYGWFFFALVLALVLGVAWRWFEREPEEAGWTAAGIAAMFGFGSMYAFRGAVREIGRREACLLVVTAWVIGAVGSIGDLWGAGNLPDPIRPPDHGPHLAQFREFPRYFSPTALACGDGMVSMF